MGKILILGGTGAMGVYLLERLKQTEHEVYVTSRSGHPDEGNIHYIEGNAKDDDFLLPLLANGYDCIIDFMVYSTFEFVDRYKQLLAAAKQYIFLSSYRVYADNGLEPITEESPLLLDVVKDAKYRKTDEYALTKARQEKLLRESGSGNYTIVRPSVTFSKLRFQLGTLEAGVLIHRMLQKRPVVFARDILKKQAAFSWAGDVAEMIECLILNPKALGEVFNVCSAEKQTWGDVAGYYREIAGLEIVPVDLKTYAKIAGGWYQIMYDRMVDRVMDNSKNCRFFITDSFHGVCFAILFNKPFICLANMARGYSRFKSLFKLFGLEDRCVFSCEEAEGRAELLHDIDYARVNRILAGERERSLKWLKNALTAPVRERSPEEMRLFETVEMLQRQINELTRDKQILYEALYLPKLKRKLRKYKLKTLFSFGKKHEKYKKAKRELKNKIRFIRRVVKQNQQY